MASLYSLADLATPGDGILSEPGRQPRAKDLATADAGSFAPRWPEMRRSG